MPKSKQHARNGVSVRIVIDTNVLLSGLFWHGTPHALLNHVRNGTAELAMSHALLDELADVISRRKFASILALTTRTPEQILVEMQALTEIVVAPPLQLPQCPIPMMMPCSHVHWQRMLLLSFRAMKTGSHIKNFSTFRYSRQRRQCGG